MPPPPPAIRPPIRLLHAVGPDRPGVASFIDAAIDEARAGVAVSVLFSEAGLDALLGPTVEPLLGRVRAAGIGMSLCARSARARRVEPARLPADVRWSSLTTFLADGGPDARLWTALS